MSARRLCALLALGVVLCSGCAALATRGDRHFARGDLAGAESAYRAYVDGRHAAGQREARALFRLALIHSLEEGELHDPRRAAHYAELLGARHPDSGYAVQASRLLALSSEAESLRAEAAALTERTEVLLGALARLQGEEAGFERARREHDEQKRSLASRIARLQAEIEALRADLAAREDELERLKKIDLEVPPP